MDKDTRVILLSALGALVIGILYSLLDAYVTMPTLRLGNFRGSWILGASFEALVTHFVVLLAVGLLLATSLWTEEDKLQYSSKEGIKQIRKLFLISLGLACLYGVFQEGILPWATQKKHTALLKNQILNELKDRALAAEKAKRYTEARYFMEYYLAMVPKDEEQQKYLDALKKKEAQEAIRPIQGQKESPNILQIKELSFQDLYDKATQYHKEGDYVTAEYFALMALKLRPNHQDLRRLLAVTQNALATAKLKPEQEARRALFQAKHQGYEYLKQGDPITAYFHFLELSKKNPKDSEIAKYLQQSFEEVKKKAFFYDEISLAVGTPVSTNLFFKNTQRQGEFLYIGKILAVGQNAYYALDIEGIGIDPEGKVKYQFQAPYGKFLDTTLLMHCVHKDDPSIYYRPRYIKGDPPITAETILPIRLSAEKLANLGRLIHTPAEVPFATALSHLEELSTLRLDPLPVVHSLLMRLQGPFTALHVFLLALIVGRVLRSKYYSRLPFVSYILIPALPFMLNIPLSFYDFELSIFVSLLIDKMSLDFYTGGAVLLGLQAVILIGILFYGVQSFTHESGT